MIEEIEGLCLWKEVLNRDLERGKEIRPSYEICRKCSGTSSGATENECHEYVTRGKHE